MTDTTETPTTLPKMMWTRCTGCQDRIYNDRQDIKIHAQHCPHDLQMTIQRLTIAIFGTHEIPKGKQALIDRLSSVEETIDELDEHTIEPAMDPDGVDPDAYTDVLGDEDTVSSATPADDDLLPATPPQINTSSLYPAAIDRDDEYTTRPFSG